MRKTFVIFLLMLLSVRMFAVDGVGSVSTSQTGGRYEIIQSNIKRSLYFKLDKFTGDVYQFVSTSDGGYTWQKINVEGKGLGSLNKSISSLNKSITYQLFMGGMMAADCILLNIVTGETFMLFEDSKTNTLYFGKIE